MWFLNNPARLNKEREAVAKLISTEDWLKLADWKLNNDTKLCFVADIEVHDRYYPIIMLYPTNYPASPPTVCPREANLHWSTHQYRSGELCLEWGSDNWHEKVTGADMLVSAHKLLEIENAAEEDSPQIVAPSRHLLTLGQELRPNCLRFIADASLTSYTRSLPEKTSGTIQFQVMSSREKVVAFIDSFSPLNGEIWCHSILPPELKKTTDRIEGYFFKTNLEVDALKLESMDSPFSVLESHGYEISQLRSTSSSLALFIDKSGGLHLFLTSNEKEWKCFAQVNINSNEENSRLLPQFFNLNSKTVGIIGLGSAGSKIATSLARTGVRDFLLVDDDVFLQENISRHELNWEDVGQHKVEGIAHQLKLIAQDVSVKSSCFKLTGQESAGIVDSILSQLGACDLIIDATADPEVLNQLSTVVCQQMKPMVWFEIYAGGIGGMIARFRPNQDPDPITTRSSLHEYLESLDIQEINGTVDYIAVDSEGEPIAACDADVAVIAANATRMALDILIEREPSDFPYSLYLIGLTREWIFEEPFHTIPKDLKNVQSNATELEVSEKEANESLEFIEQLILKQKNDNLSTD